MSDGNGTQKPGLSFTAGAINPTVQQTESGAKAGGSRSEGFAKVTRSVARDKRLSATDRTILNFLMTYSPNWRLYQPFVVRELELSSSTVARSVKRLDAAGYLTYQKRLRKNGFVRDNIRVLREPTHWEPISLPVKKSGSSGTDKSKTKRSSVNQDTPHMSSSNGVHVTGDTSVTSPVTHNVELSQSSFVDVATKIDDVYTVIKSVVAEEALLWTLYNSPPLGFTKIVNSNVLEANVDLILKMDKQMRDVRDGLHLQLAQKDQHGLDSGYYKKWVLNELRSRNKGRSDKYFVHILGDGVVVFEADVLDNFNGGSFSLTK